MICKQRRCLTHHGLLWLTNPWHGKRATACSRQCDEEQRMLMHTAFPMLISFEGTAWAAFNAFLQDHGVTRVGRDCRRSLVQPPAEAGPALQSDESALHHPLWLICKDVKHKRFQDRLLWYTTSDQHLDGGWPTNSLNLIIQPTL